MNHRTEKADRSRAAALVHWFAAHQRQLPWRTQRSGYSALVAEAMLQQTQVSRVIERFDAFMQRYPSVADLAAADEQAVLTMWRGLGYYRRARNLHRAAQMIMSEFGGSVPDTVDELLQLPGVGRYTAGAIASIVHNNHAAIVDGNVRRVLMRWWNRDSADDRWCWQKAEALVHETDQPGMLNEALMELGATVCLPRNPRCEACPVAKYCNAFAAGRQMEIPAAKRSPERKTVHHHCLVITRRERILLEQRPANGLWSSMWQPPTIESATQLEPRQFSALLPFSITRVTKVESFVHHTTHRLVNVHVHIAGTRVRNGRWQLLDELSEVPIGNAHRKAIDCALTGATVMSC